MARQVSNTLLSSTPVLLPIHSCSPRQALLGDATRASSSSFEDIGSPSNPPAQHLQKDISTSMRASSSDVTPPAAMSAEGRNGVEIVTEHLTHDDHPDSPMRKKPRLNEDEQLDVVSTDETCHRDAASLATSSDSATVDMDTTRLPSTPEQPTEQTTPCTPLSSKVTLNLKPFHSESPLSSPSHPPPKPLPEEAHHSESPTSSVVEIIREAEQRQGSSDDPIVLPVDVVSENPDSPVIEIAADDSYDLHADAGDVVQIYGMASIEETLIDQFPGLGDHSGVNAAKTLAQSFDRVELHPARLEAVTTWLKDWITMVGASRTKRHNGYTSYEVLWTSLATIANKLVRRRELRGHQLIRGDSWDQAVTDFLRQYLIICAHHIHMDMLNLLEVVGVWPADTRIPSTRYLSTLPKLVDADHQASMTGTIPSSTSAFDDQPHQKSLVAGWLSDMPGAYRDLNMLMIVLLHKLETWPEIVRDPLHDGLLTIVRVSETLPHSLASESQLTDIYIRPTIQVMHTLNAEFPEHIAKQPAGFSAEWNRELVDYSARITHSMLRLDHDLVHQLSDKLPDLPSDPEVSSLTTRAKMVANQQQYNLAWKLATKGRLEIRILGVNVLQDLLIALHKDYHMGTSMEFILQQMSTLLLNDNVLDHLLSKDSHPEVLVRSGLVMAFLHLTNRYPTHLTDTIFDILTSASDPRVINALSTAISNSAAHMQIHELLDFCRRIGNLSPEHLASHLVQPLRQLTSAMIQNDLASSSVEDVLVVPLMCLGVSEKTFNPSDYSSFPDDVRNAAIQCFNDYSIQLKANHRKRLYNDCVEHVKARDSRSIGSTEVLISLLSDITKDDVKLLVGEPRMLQFCVDELSYFLQTEGIKGHSWQQFRIGLLTHLDLFKLIVMHNSHPLGLEADRALLELLVGSRSPSVDARTYVWGVLTDLATKLTIACPFIESCIHSFLPSLDPDLYTSNICSFLQAATDYCVRIRAYTKSDDDTAVEIPLTDILWKIMACAQDTSIAQSAIKTLCMRFVDPKLLKQVSLASIEKAHINLVKRSFTELGITASVLRKSSTSSQSTDELLSMDVPTDAKRVYDAQIAFSNITQFLKQFFVDIRQWPSFYPRSTVQSDLKAGSDTQQSETGETIQFTFQSFDQGCNSRSTLKIPKTCTYADLHEKIILATGFRHFEMFAGGQKVKLLENPLVLAGSTFPGKGNVLIRNSSDRKSSPSLSTQSTMQSLAEKELYCHFDDLFRFLDLEDRWSVSVLQILELFPPHPKINDLISSNESYLELFPPGRLVKASYSLVSMRNHLRNELQTGQRDKTALHRSTRTLTSAITSAEMGYNLRKLNNVASGEHPSSSETQSGPVSASYTGDYAHLLSEMLDCLIAFLQESTLPESEEPFFEEPDALVDRIFLIFDTFRGIQPSAMVDKVMCLAYCTMFQASLHDGRIWSLFTRHGSCGDLHSWLLLEYPSPILRRNIQAVIDGAMLDPKLNPAVQRRDLAIHYWSIVAPLVPQSAQHPQQSEQLLTAALAVFSVHIEFGATESEIRQCFATWSSMLLEVSPNCPRHVLGLARLMLMCVNHLTTPESPVQDETLVRDIFARFLFPNPAALEERFALAKRFEAIEVDSQLENTLALHPPSPGNGAHDASLLPSPDFAMVLDDESRLAIYELILHLCGYTELLSKLIYMTDKTILTVCTSDYDDDWNIERTTWMRSKAGYMGLRNLSNTCYINSLIVQLYMTEKFRNFILDLPCPHPNDSTELLGRTQQLFKYMNESTGRYADTQEFVASIKPYDAEHIDVNIQMDVDEFYNLLFERWEGQMPSNLAKTQLRTYFGGQLVTQVKSMECQHISERLEPFLAIQCEVKGQHTLTNSLKSYVEGDVMNGDNKYKCESCGGKLVNAVKRSCLKDVPDHLTFHLKRFDYDVQYLQRTKINDRFEFPEQINMAPYRVESLNGEADAVKEDIFVLTGILIHTGTAEAGHYYSLIRLTESEMDNAPIWAEFNDRDVSLFDRKDIPSQAFGGVGVEDANSGVKQNHFWNAYMLFYQRASSLMSPSREAVVGSLPSPKKSVGGDAAGLSSMQILRENQQRALRYCLFDPSASRFVRSLVVKMKDLQANACSNDHQVERQVYGMLLPFAERILARSKDQVGYMEAFQGILKFTSTCTTCSAFIVDWILSPKNRTFAHNLLVRCPIPAVRQIFSDFLSGLLRLVKAREPALYGCSSDDGNISKGQFSAVVDFLDHALTDIGRWAPYWDTFFEFIYKLTQLGHLETRYLISRGIFSSVLHLLMLEYSPEAKRLNSTSVMHMRDSARKQYPYNALIRLLPPFLDEIDIFGNPVEDERDRLKRCELRMPEKLPITADERFHLEFWAPEPRQLRLIGKVFEAWDDSHESYAVPICVVENIMHAGPSDEMVKKLSKTIRNSLVSYYPSFVSGFLLAAVNFCRYSEDRAASLDVVDAVCRSTADLESAQRRKDVPLFYKLWEIRVDADCHLPQRGREHLGALVQLSNCSGDDSDANSSHYLRHIIRMAPDWAPSLLLYDGDGSSVVKAGTNKALQALIFRHYPQFSLEADEADDMSIIRTRAVNDLFIACTSRMSESVDTALPRSAYDEMYQVCRQCESWIQRLRQDQGPAFAQLLDQVDSGITHRWLTVSKLLNSLPDQDDAQFEDSDMYEESLDTEDDELGNTPIALS